MPDNTTDDLLATARRNIKILMAVRGIDTVRELAQRVGRNEAALTQKLSGRNRIHIEDLDYIAEVLGVEPGQLLSRNVATVVGAITATGTSGVRHADDTLSGGEQITRQIWCSVDDLSGDLSNLALVDTFIGRRTAQLAAEEEAEPRTVVTPSAIAQLSVADSDKVISKLVRSGSDHYGECAG